LQQRRDSPSPIICDLGSFDYDSGGDEGADEPGGIEHGGHDCAFFGVGEFSKHSGAGNYTEDDAETEDHSGDDVHGGLGDVSMGSCCETTLSSHTVFCTANLEISLLR